MSTLDVFLQHNQHPQCLASTHCCVSAIWPVTCVSSRVERTATYVTGCERIHSLALAFVCMGDWLSFHVEVLGYFAKTIPCPTRP